MEDITNSFKKNRYKIFTCLRMTDSVFLEKLYEQELFPFNLWDEVKTQKTRADKSSHFLDKAIDLPLKSGAIEPFIKLLKVLSDKDNKEIAMQQLAAGIITEINNNSAIVEG